MTTLTHHEVWKFDVPLGEPVDLPTPVLHFDTPEHGNARTLYAWADSLSPMARHQVFGTGQIIPDGAVHVASTVTYSGLVWHLFNTQAVPS